MIYAFDKEYNMRGYAFEYISKILLRRQTKNNFIFQLSQFDSIDEILTKYRLQVPDKLAEIISLFRSDWNRCDLILFELDYDRTIINIQVFDVKTKFHTVDRDYFEICKSNEVFCSRLISLGISVQIISIILFENWRFGFNIYDYQTSRKRVYSNYKV